LYEGSDVKPREDPKPHFLPISWQELRPLSHR
jgi:hypothetical protein